MHLLKKQLNLAGLLFFRCGCLALLLLLQMLVVKGFMAYVELLP